MFGKKCFSKIIGEFSSQEHPEPGTITKHNHLGDLVFDRDLGWRGTYILDGNPIEIIVDGSMVPDPELTEALMSCLSRPEVFVKDLYTYIEGELRKRTCFSPLKSDDFEITTISFLWQGDPGRFFVWLRHPEDEYKLWRVTYVNNKPEHFGFDD